MGSEGTEDEDDMLEKDEAGDTNAISIVAAAVTIGSPIGFGEVATLASVPVIVAIAIAVVVAAVAGVDT